MVNSNETLAKLRINKHNLTKHWIFGEKKQVFMFRLILL